MPTTTNYGWTTPADTDLVKDGASAIRTLGTSIDTTTKNLNPSTTLGDIEYRSSSANTNTRLPIGSTGQVLTVSGGVPAWAAASGGAGNMVQIATGSLSGTSVTLSSLSSYTDLILYITGAGNSIDGNWKLNLTLNNNTGSNYNYILFYDQNNNPDRDEYTTTGLTIPQNFFQVGDNNNNAFWGKFYNCKNAGFTDWDLYAHYRNPNSNAGKCNFQSKGVFTNSAAISSIEIKNSGSYTWDAGTYTLWGA
jgi:hypothetical protein